MLAGLGALSGCLTGVCDRTDNELTFTTLDGTPVLSDSTGSITTIDFGSVIVGLSRQVPFTMGGTCGEPTILSFEPGTGDTSLTIDLNLPDFPQENLADQATFAPVAEGDVSATFLITTTSDSTRSPQTTLVLKGHGALPPFVVTPNPLDFGVVETPSAPCLPLTFTNKSDSGLSLDCGQQYDLGVFSVSATSIPLIEPGGSATITACFDCNAPGICGRLESASFSCSACPTCYGVQIDLSGTNVDKCLSIDPFLFAQFGKVPVGATETKTIRLENQCQRPINLTGLTYTGDLCFSVGGVPTSFPAVVPASGDIDLVAHYTAAGMSGTICDEYLEIDTDDPQGPTFSEELIAEVQ